MIHGLITLAWCILCAVLEFPWPFYFWPVAFYAGREVAQAECRYIEAHGGKRASCSRLCGFFPSAWTAKGMSDWICPLVSALAFTVCRFFF